MAYACMYVCMYISPFLPRIYIEEKFYVLLYTPDRNLLVRLFLRNIKNKCVVITANIS